MTRWSSSGKPKTKALCRSDCLPELGGLRNVVEPLQRQDRLGKVLRTRLQHRAGEGEKLLAHRLRSRERGRLAGGIVVQPLVHAVLGGDRNPGAERMGAADLQTVVLHAVELVGERIDRGVAAPAVVILAEAA